MAYYRHLSVDYVQNKIQDCFVIYWIMSIIGTIYEDVPTDALGDIGSWQWLVTILSTILMANNFFQHYEYIFLLQPNKVLCITNEEQENVYNETLCSYMLSNGTEIPCEKWHLKLLWVIWVKKSWLLFCDEKRKLLLTAVVFRLATIFGFVIFGLVADSYGRKNAILVNVFAVIVFKTVIIFCDSEAWFRLFLFLEALFGTATTFMGLIVVSEIASNGWRTCLNIIVMSPLLLALVSKVHIANAASNPETYNLIACIFGIFSMLILRWYPESPQWMLFNRKIDKAEKLLAKAANKNNIRFSAEFKIRPVNQRAYSCLDETLTYVQVLRARNVRVIIAVPLLFWGLYYFIWGYLYLKIYSVDVADLTISLKVLCALIVMGFMAVFLSRKISMERFLIINIFFTACFTAGVIILEHRLIHEILSALSLASGLLVHALILTMTPRYYAINIRATLFGCCHATGQLGAMISYIMFIYKAMDDVTFVILELGLSVLLVGLSFFLPRVDGREMPDVMEDMNYFSELSKPLRWVTQKRSSASKEEVQMRIYSYGSALSDCVPSTPVRNYRNKNVKSTWQRLLDCIQKKHRPPVQRNQRTRIFAPSDAMTVIASNSSNMESTEKSSPSSLESDIDVRLSMRDAATQHSAKTLEVSAIK